MAPRGRRVAAVVLLLVALVAGGCSTSWADWSIGDVQPTLPGESAESLVEVDLAALEPIGAAVLWRQKYQGFLGAQMGPRGDYTVVYGSLPGGLGLDLLDKGGRRLWQFRYSDAGLKTLRADVRGTPPLVSAVAGDGSSNSVVSVFDLQGRELWRRRVTGSSASLVMSADGQRFALLEPVTGRLLLLDARGTELNQFKISPDAQAAFYRRGDNLLLINDADHVRLVSRSGQVLLDQDISREFQRSVVLSPAGDRVAVTTRGSDSTAYVFDIEGNLLWSKPLFVGGSNQPAFSPDGLTLYIYNVGDGAGIYGLDAATGEVTLRLFPAVPENRRALVRGMWTAPDAVLVDYVTVPRSGGGAGEEEHVLLAASPDASRTRSMFLGRGVEIDITDDGRRLLVVQRQGPPEAPATVLTVYDLDAAARSAP